MKPRNKFERRVLVLAKKLKPITETDEAYFREKAIDNQLFDNGKVTTCNRCGHQFRSLDLKNMRTLTYSCPGCNRKAKIEKTRKVTYRETKYVSIVTTVEDVQVVRMYLMVYAWRLDNMKNGYTAINEVFRLFVSEDGNYAIMARLTHQPSMYIDQYNLNSDIDLRPPHDRYFVAPWVSRTHRITPELRRRGFDGNFHNVIPIHLFVRLMTNSHAETLWKAKYYEFVAGTHCYATNEYWDQLKIVLRNKYKIKDAQMWFDHMHTLKELHLDTHSPHYICPKNLAKTHSVLQKRLNRLIQKKRLEEERKNIRKREGKYAEDFKYFIGIAFGDDNLNLHVLGSVQEFYDEGVAMHHCVYSNKYYSKQDTCIISARSKGKRLATIELNLKSMKIMQCRGVCNAKPERDEEIRLMLQNNLSIFRKAKTLNTKQKIKNLPLTVS